MVRHPVAVLWLAWSAASTALPAQTPAPPVPFAPPDSLAIRTHTWFLAHDLLEGRGTGRRGHDVAALYVATEARRLGLTGAGEQGGYFQPVPIVEADIVTSATRLAVTQDGPAGPRTAELRYGVDFIPNVGTARTLVSFSGPAVWVGTARDVLARPGDLPPLGGGVALMLGVFGSDGAAADTLRARGAAGVVHLLPDPEMFQLYVNSRGPSRLYLADPAAPSSFIPDLPAVIAGPALLGRLDSVIVQAGGRDRMAALAGVRVTAAIGVRPHDLPSRNVAAMLAGADPARRGQFLVYTAHLDHLGISTPDAAGDSLYNGFSDNAAGSAMLLAIAQAMLRGPRPARSVLFLWFTGEERGLLGSDWFVARPLVAPDSIVGVINLDAGAPPAPAVEWHVAGGTRSTLGALAAQTARAAGWNAEARPPSPNSDYFPFLRVGVPAVFLVPAPGAYEGLTLAASQALRARWDAYHQASDHWHADFPFAGLVRYADFALRLGRALDAAPRPHLVGGR